MTVSNSAGKLPSQAARARAVANFPAVAASDWPSSYSLTRHFQLLMREPSAATAASNAARAASKLRRAMWL